MPIALFALNYSHIPPPQAIDIAFINGAGEKGIPLVMEGIKAHKPEILDCIQECMAQS